MKDFIVPNSLLSWGVAGASSISLCKLAASMATGVVPGVGALARVFPHLLVVVIARIYQKTIGQRMVLLMFLGRNSGPRKS